MAIKIPIVADVANAIRGAGDVADAFEDVQDSLDDVVKDAKRAEEAIEDVGTGGEKAGDAADDMARKFRDDFDQIRKDSKSAGDGVGKSLKDGTDRASDGIDDLKGEAGDTAREVGASFDGSADSIAEGFQEVAANAFTGFGPAGAAAGLAVAAGIGIAIAQLQKYAEKIAEAKAAGAEWATEFNTASIEERIDALRGSWEELGATITDSKEWYEIGQKNAVSAIEDIAAAARDGVGDVDSFVEAFNTTDPAERLDALKDSLSNIDRQIADLGPAWKATLGGPDAEQAYVDRKEVLNNLRGVVEDQIRVQENANEIEAAYAESASGTAAALADKNEAIEESNELLEENIDANRSLISAEFELQDAQKALNEVLETGVKRGRQGKEALYEYSGSVIDAASAAADASGDQEDYNRSISEGRERFIRAAQAMGYTRDQAQALARQMGLIPRKVEIEATDNGSSNKTRREVEDLLEYGGIKKDVTLGVRASTAQASIDVANWRHAQQSIPVQIGMRAV